MLVPPESSSAVLVMLRSKSVSIGNHSRARLVDSNIIRVFWSGYPNLMRSYGGLLEPRGRNLHRWNRLMLKIWYAGCLGQSRMVLAQFTLEMCIAVWNREKNTKNPYFGVQGRSRLSMLVPRKARQQCLLWYAASLCLSATVLLLDWSTVAKTALFKGSTQIWCTRMEDSLIDPIGCQNMHC